jgi:hypothetical protein
MAFNPVDSAKIDAYNRQQDTLRKALSAYLEDAKNDVSDQDRADIKSGLQSRLQQVGSDLVTLTARVTDLLSQVQQQLGTGLSPSTIGGCAKTMAQSPSAGSAAAEGVSGLLSPLKSLLSLVQSMAGNVKGMISDAAAL